MSRTFRSNLNNNKTPEIHIYQGFQAFCRVSHNQVSIILDLFFEKTNFWGLRIVYYVVKGVEALKSTKELKELMFQYTESLIRIAYYYVKDLQAAEDIVQEVFIKFYNSQINYEERGEVKGLFNKNDC